MVELRGTPNALTGTATLTAGGIGVKVSESAPIKLISWDRIRGVKLDKGDADAALITLGDRLMRVRTRLERGDTVKAGELIEPLYARAVTDGVSGPTGMVLAECVVRSRLAHGRIGGATLAWLEWLNTRAAHEADKKTEWIGARTSLPTIMDEATGICPSLPPIFGRAMMSEAALTAFARHEDWTRLSGLDSRVLGFIGAYQAAAMFEAGESVVTAPGVPPTEGKASDAERLVIDIVIARVGGDEARASARQRLSRRLEIITRGDDARENSDPSIVPEDRSWMRPWIHAAIGRSMLREDDEKLRRAGMVELMHVPALFGRSQPRLAALCLADVAEELKRLNEKPESIAAVERELRTRFGAAAIGIDESLIEEERNDSGGNKEQP